jgi:NADH-quinone oxidoreductase subunit N
VEHGASMTGWFWLALVAVAGVAISFWYYFGVVRALYWSGEPADESPLDVSPLTQFSLAVCVGGILFVGVFPAALWDAAVAAVAGLRL